MKEVALITGASGGIGEQLAELDAAKGRGLVMRTVRKMQEKK
jgi:short-subunit dehydrogenase